MKKKMLFMAAIAGLVTLGSCVKDDVSSSVEAVRMAKANELNAKANDYNAAADLKKAQTALANATQAAEVAIKQAQAVAAQLANEATEMNNQVKSAALAAEIAKTIADYEDQTATSNANAQFQLNNLAQYLRDVSQDAFTAVNAVIGKYKTALGAYNTAQKNVITAKLALDKAKKDLEHAAEVKEYNIDAQNKIIAQNEKKIELLNELKAKVGEG